MWRHGDVAWAMYETLLMAFLGTFGAAIVALPLGFLAAKNFTPLRSIRFASRRVFDFLRGVDGLIWTIVLSRAFGPGPLTGALAILMTDTGSFGKMFSEALENIDDKQVEGVTSTGAKPLQLSRIQYSIGHDHRSNHRRRDRSDAYPSDWHSERLGRGHLLYRADHHYGYGDGYVFRMAPA